MSHEFLEAAKRYASLGLAVVPLMKRSKKPIFTDWTNLPRADGALVERWWSSTPEANIGILTGQKSGVFVLDVDSKNGGNDTYSELLAQHGQMPDTWEVMTGNGGRHCYFRFPAFDVRNVAGLLPGIDIRGTGGQVVAPPSIHPETGRRYEWDGLREIEETPIAEAPPWLIDLLVKHNKPEFKTARTVPDKIHAGVRNSTLVSLAGSMRRLGLNEQEMLPTLLQVNRERCEPPEAEAAIHTIAHSMMRYRPADRELFITAARLWKLTKKSELEHQQKLQQLKIDPKDGLAVYRSQLVGAAPVIDRLLYNGLTIFAGKSKIGKSFVALQLALAVAMASPALGQRTVMRPGGVIYYMLEMGENRTSSRLRQLLASEDITLQNIDFVWECLPMSRGGMEQLGMLIEGKKPSLVIIDTFTAFAQGKQGSPSGDILREQYSEIDKLRKLAEAHDTAILLVHHTRKSGAFDTGAEGVDMVAGSRGVTAACDSVWILRKQQDESFVLDIVGRDVEEQCLAMKLEREPVGWKIIGDAESVRQSSEDAEVLAIIASEGNATAAKIGSLLRMQRQKTEAVLARLHRDGMIGKRHTGSYYATVEDSQWKN